MKTLFAMLNSYISFFLVYIYRCTYMYILLNITLYLLPIAKLLLLPKECQNRLYYFLRRDAGGLGQGDDGCGENNEKGSGSRDSEGRKT